MLKGKFFSPKTRPEVGHTLLYRLRPDQLPTKPEEVWNGCIKQILVNIHDRQRRRYYVVTSLKPGYEGEPELVYPEQVVGFVRDATPS
ncbi:MAG TPA: hypothetical protein VFV38_49060 [Ktedonobacteraceae bacterium]|nr:hypothetical protein [Ktedonobacteraceae bacterium]